MGRRAGEWRATVLCAVLCWVGCSEPRPEQLGEATCPTYEGQVKELLEARCAQCHGEAQAAGGYRVDGYLGAVARREDGTPRVAAGQDASRVLVAARGELEGHEAVPESELAVLKDWVVRCELPPRRYSFHVNGWMDPGNAEDFHGRVLRADAYRTEGCQQCHGEHLEGGTSGVSCQTCHSEGLNTCSSCHGDMVSAAPPKDVEGLTSTTLVSVGAHRTHLEDGPRHKAYACETCHRVPIAPEDIGHYRLEDGSADMSPAEVFLAEGPLGAASWRASSATCSNSACHAPAVDARATRQEPRWNVVGQGEAACGTCHGLPPSSHAEDERCETCHRPAYDGEGHLRPEAHANGQVELAAAAGSCTGCHGDATSAAPPQDLSGRSDEGLRTVGAHRAHLEARHRLSAPVACTECHKVPATLADPGHIDEGGPAELFPSVAGVGTLARANGTVASYDAAEGTCTTYCHGAGALLSMDTAPGRVSRPSWTGGTPEAACGTCHGVPPRLPGSPSHNGVSVLSQCVQCHPQTVLPGGGIRVEKDASGKLTSTHIDGIIQYQPPQ